MKSNLITAAILVASITLFAGQCSAFSVDNKKMYNGCDNQSPNWLWYGFGMRKNSCLVSPSGNYMAIFQGDGNFVTYRIDGVRADKKNGGKTVSFSSSGKTKAHWSTGSEGKGGKSLVMQGDGNLVIYSNKKPIWASNTVTHDKRVLILLDSGELVIYKVNAATGKEYGPKIGWGNHRQFKNGKAGYSKVFGSWFKPVNTGIYIANVHDDRATHEFDTFSLKGQMSARTFISNCQGSKPATGSRELAASVTTSKSWGKSATIGISTTIGFEVGSDALGKLKTETTVSGEFTTSSSGTKEQSKSSSIAADFDVDPSYKQEFNMLVNKITSIYPYDGYRFQKIEGKNYLTRHFIHTEMKFVDASNAHVVYGSPVKCN